MLLFAVFLAVTGAASTSTRVVVVHDGELLRSEQRFVAAVKIASGAAVEDATPAEATFVREGGAMPESWRSSGTVVVLTILPPRVDKKAQRLSRGLGSVLVFHPPSATPVYAEKAEMPESSRPSPSPDGATKGERVDGGSDLLLDEALAKWVARLLMLPARPSP